MEDAQYRRELSVQCANVWQAAIELYIDDACYTSVDSMNPAGWDEDQAYNDLYGRQECLAQLCSPFDIDAAWMGELVKKRVEAFRDNHTEDDQGRLFR